MYKIFIVEDDATIAAVLAQTIRKWGFEAVGAEDFSAVAEQFIRVDPQLVLMDISLPFYNGYHWCNEIRKISKVPIIFISSNSDNMDIIMAMNMGGDDFITKPFDLNVLIAKIQAVLRRAYAYQGQLSIIEYGGVVLNLNDTTFTYQEEKAELTKNEFRILELLMEKAGTVVAREEIMQRLWNDECFIDDNTLTVNIARLRKKLDAAGLSQYIQTKKGIGYIIGSGGI